MNDHRRHSVRTRTHHPRTAPGHRTRRALHVTTLALGAVVCAGAPVLAQTSVFSPADRAQLEGSNSTSFPLGRANMRLQTLHDDLGTAPRSIQGHGYRRDAENTHGALAEFKVDMAVSLSIAPVTAASPSSTFANNVGTPITVVPRHFVSFPATDRPAQAPAATSEFRIPYLMPFAYPSGGGTLCVDTIVYGNDGPNGINANFTAYMDAHEQFPDGRAIQPGYRYGQGCPAPGASTAATATFELRYLPTDMELSIEARNGLPTDANGNGVSALMFGVQRGSMPWPAGPGCQFLTSNEVSWLLPGANTSTGSWSGVLNGFAPLPVGLAFTVQVASGHLQRGVCLSDASDLVMPPFGPLPRTAVRIANQNDGSAPTGTVSYVVPVTEFF
jgi:hypothetical protein